MDDRGASPNNLLQARVHDGVPARWSEISSKAIKPRTGTLVRSARTSPSMTQKAFLGCEEAESGPNR